MKPTTIVAALPKGGCGKSTLAWALASFLSKDHSTLAIDLDPQGTLTHALASVHKFTVQDALKNQTPPEECIVPALAEYSQHLRVLPSSPLLTNLEGSSALDPNRQFLIADLVDQVGDRFKYIIIDAPAGQSLLTIAPLVVPNAIAVSPVATQPPAFGTVGEFRSTLNQIKRRLNPGLRWFLAANLYDGARQLLDREVLQALSAEYCDLMVEPPLRKRVGITEDFSLGKPCRHEDFEIFTHNLLERIHQT